MSPREKKSESITEDVVLGQEEQADDFLLFKEENRKAAERHVLRKLDMRLMATVVIIYFVNNIDVSCSIVTVRIW